MNIKTFKTLTRLIDPETLHMLTKITALDNKINKLISEVNEITTSLKKK